MPRSASSADNARIVTCGSRARRSSSHPRCTSSSRPRLPPIGSAAALPVERWRCDHFTTLDTLTAKSLAVSRQVRPLATTAATRSRSFDYALAIHAGLPPASILNHKISPA